MSGKASEEEFLKVAQDTLLFATFSEKYCLWTSTCQIFVPADKMCSVLCINIFSFCYENGFMKPIKQVSEHALPWPLTTSPSTSPMKGGGGKSHGYNCTVNFTGSKSPMSVVYAPFLCGLSNLKFQSLLYLNRK